MTIYKYIIIFSLLINSALCSDQKSTDKKEDKKAEEIKDEKKIVKEVAVETNNAKEKSGNASRENDGLSEGSLRIKIKNMQEIIDHDRGMLAQAEKNFNSFNNYDGSPIQNKRLARKYKSEIKSLKRRIAVHEGMVKQWESVLIQTTGKL